MTSQSASAPTSNLPTEFLLLRSKGMLSKVYTPINRRDKVLLPKDSCRYLWMMLDGNFAKTVGYQLCSLSDIQKFLPGSAADHVVHSLISSRMDLCAAILANLPDYQLKRLQNSAARLVTYIITHPTISQVTSLASDSCSCTIQDPSIRV